MGCCFFRLLLCFLFYILFLFLFFLLLIQTNSTLSVINSDIGALPRDLGSGSDADRGSGFRIQGHCTATRPRSSGSELHAMLHRTVREIQSSSAIRTVFVMFGAHARPQWIRMGIWIQWIRFQCRCGEPHKQQEPVLLLSEKIRWPETCKIL